MPRVVKKLSWNDDQDRHRLERDLRGHKSQSKVFFWGGVNISLVVGLISFNLLIPGNPVSTSDYREISTYNYTDPNMALTPLTPLASMTQSQNTIGSSSSGPQLKLMPESSQHFSRQQHYF